jgi:hypothetical protein
MASQLVFALDGAGMTGQVAVVTDGQLSGLVNKGIVVGEVSPEAARGGPLALVRDGDMIRIDVPGRTADLDVAASELAQRRADLPPRPPSQERGWLSAYARLVRPLPEGAVLLPPGGHTAAPPDPPPAPVPAVDPGSPAGSLRSAPEPRADRPQREAPAAQRRDRD